MEIITKSVELITKSDYEELKAFIEVQNDKYYNNDEPELTDFEYKPPHPRDFSRELGGIFYFVRAVKYLKCSFPYGTI